MSVSRLSATTFMFSSQRRAAMAVTFILPWNFAVSFFPNCLAKPVIVLVCIAKQFTLFTFRQTPASISRVTFGANMHVRCADAVALPTAATRVQPGELHRLVREQRVGAVCVASPFVLI